VSESQKECQMCVTRIDTKNGWKMNQDQFGVRVSKESQKRVKRVSNVCQSVKRESKECQMCVKCDDTKMVEKWIKIKSVSECQKRVKRVSNVCQSVKRESKECQMCVTMIDTKNGWKMNQDQFGVSESKRVSNWHV